MALTGFIGKIKADRDNYFYKSPAHVPDFMKRVVESNSDSDCFFHCMKILTNQLIEMGVDPEMLSVSDDEIWFKCTPEMDQWCYIRKLDNDEVVIEFGSPAA